MLEAVNAGSLLAGVLVHVRLKPPLGQLPAYEALLGIPRAFPLSLALLHLGQLPLQLHDGALSAALAAAACAAHVATGMRYRRAPRCVLEQAGLAHRARAAWPPSLPLGMRVFPISPACGLALSLPRLRASAARVRVDRGVEYYPAGAAPSRHCRLDVWHAPEHAAAAADRPAVLYAHGGAWNMGHR